MAATVKLYAFSGDTGWGLSLGFKEYVERIKIQFGFELSEYGDNVYQINLTGIVQDILAQPPERMIVILGYSLGANALAWLQLALLNYCNLRNLPVRDITLLVGFDPTKNGPSLNLYPIESHVKRCLLFRQRAWWFPTSLMFGRGQYARRANGPQIEVTDVYEDHWFLQGDRNLQKICTDVILTEERKWKAA